MLCEQVCRHFNEQQLVALPQVVESAMRVLVRSLFGEPTCWTGL